MELCCTFESVNYHNKMKRFVFSILSLVLLSCGTYHNNVVSHDERYVIFCTDSFDIYYNIDTLIHYCEEMKNPHSSLYNEYYSKISDIDVDSLKCIKHDVKFNVENYSAMTSFDSNKSKSELLSDVFLYGAARDVEYLFYKEKKVLIKSHYCDSVFDDYIINTFSCDVGDYVGIYDRKINRLLYGFKWMGLWNEKDWKQFK